jgi:CheY-like chemotaxis protein
VQLLEQLLSEAGYTRSRSTMNPQEVCALHRKHAFDLILLDLQMPGDGRLPGDRRPEDQCRRPLPAGDWC